tara:strand:+ start:723 stop:1055 length:333 start_codon:yes stop_codon:yes gene_type:complete
MPTNVYKILGQHNSTANLIADVYTVPTTNSAVLSSITVCNQTAANVSYSIAIAPNGEAANDKHFIVRGGTVPAADAIGITLGLTMDAQDVVRCNTNTSNVSFSVFGSEVY